MTDVDGIAIPDGLDLNLTRLRRRVDALEDRVTAIELRDRKTVPPRIWKRDEIGTPVSEWLAAIDAEVRGSDAN